MSEIGLASPKPNMSYFIQKTQFALTDPVSGKAFKMVQENWTKSYVENSRYQGFQIANSGMKCTNYST